jgi:hypothetical protein
MAVIFTSEDGSLTTVTLSQSPNLIHVMLLMHCLSKITELTADGVVVVQFSFTSTALSLGGLQSPGYRGKSTGMPDSRNKPFLQMDILEQNKKYTNVLTLAWNVFLEL